jgi:hypothetical protein
LAAGDLIAAVLVADVLLPHSAASLAINLTLELDAWTTPRVQVLPPAGPQSDVLLELLLDTLEIGIDVEQNGCTGHIDHPILWTGVATLLHTFYINDDNQKRGKGVRHNHMQRGDTPDSFIGLRTCIKCLTPFVLTPKASADVEAQMTS